jgi:chorismate mutase
MASRGIRGATTVAANTADEIYAAAKELLAEIVTKNALDIKDIASIVFSATDDLDAAYPAVAARDIGYGETPLFCTREMSVRGSLSMCLRVLIHINTEKTQKEMNHVYLKGAQVLRPDIVKGNN